VTMPPPADSNPEALAAATGSSVGHTNKKG
jgi:hypothetical protein